MYIRFVTNEFNEASNQRLGIFHAVRYLRDDGELSSLEFSVADKLFDWFSANLESPLDFLYRQKSRKSTIYISWFKSSAIDHIAKARELSAVLENKDICVEMLTTSTPGKTVYEDEFQIFSKPFDRF